MAHVVISPDGQIHDTYRKMHLFDVSLPEYNINYQESAIVRPGGQPVVVENTPLGKIGLGVVSNGIALVHTVLFLLT
jgi:predicted amidohydrolase